MWGVAPSVLIGAYARERPAGDGPLNSPTRSRRPWPLPVQRTRSRNITNALIQLGHTSIELLACRNGETTDDMFGSTPRVEACSRTPFPRIRPRQRFTQYGEHFGQALEFSQNAFNFSSVVRIDTLE